MFVASYARLPPGSRFHLNVNVQIFPCNARNRILRLQSGLGRTVYYSARYHLGTTSLRLGPFITMRGTASVPLGPSVTMRGAASVPLGPFYRSGPLLQCAVPPRNRSDPLLQCAVPPRYRSGPLLQCAVPPRYRFGTARALHYNARYRHPICVLQSFNWIGVRNFQENTKTNGKPRTQP